MAIQSQVSKATGNFRNALNKTTITGKTKIVQGKIQTSTGNWLTVENWCFYKPMDAFLKEDSQIVYSGKLLGTPSMEVPIPKVKRIADFTENRFFISKNQGEPVHPIKGITLYAPWHYFYFERRETEHIHGYRKIFKEKWTSKIDMEISFYSGIEREETIPEIKDQAMDMYEKLFFLERERKEAENLLDKFDPDRKLEIEYLKVQEKLKKSLKAFGGFEL